MPELPEVEALAADLRRRVVGHAITRVEVSAISALKTFDPSPTALHGQLVTGAGRFGKFLDIVVAGSPADGSDHAPELHLVVHLSRAGWLHYRDALPATPLKPGKGPIALRVRLDTGGGFDLTEQGTQKRLAAYLVRDPALVPGVAKLGPDALGSDLATFGARIRGRRGQVKGVLTDQEVLAGVGNAYSDEVLHAARMSPFKIAATLTEEDVATLHEAIVTTLRDAVERSRGLEAQDLKGEKKTGLRVHARTGQKCPVCGDTIREVSFADSSLQYCPTCQTGGKPLADRRLSRLLK